MRPIVARDLMNPDVLTVRDNMSVAELAAFLTNHEITGAPVVNTDDEVVGVVSLVDVARADSHRAGRSSAWNAVATTSYLHDWERGPEEDGIQIYHLQEEGVLVRDVMNPAVYAVGEEAEVPEIVEILLEQHLHRVMVIEDDRLVGIISTSDLLGLFLEDDD